MFAPFLIIFMDIIMIPKKNPLAHIQESHNSHTGAISCMSNALCSRLYNLTEITKTNDSLCKCGILQMTALLDL